MRILKIIGIFIVLVIALYLVACMMGPKRVDAERSTTINAPVSLVYNTITDLATWKDWSYWTVQDTGMQITYGDKTSGLGANYRWVDGKGETGKMEIVEAEPNQRMKSQIQFGNWPGYSNGEWTLTEGEEGVNVSWHMTNDTDIPFLARAFLIKMDDMIGADFEKGLANLKEYVEKKAAGPFVYSDFEIGLVEIPARKFAAHRENIPMAKMPEFFGVNFSNLMGMAMKSGAELDGAPCGLYFTWDEANGMADMAAAIGVKSDIPLGEGDSMIEVPAGTAAMIEYYGAYEGLGKAHMAMDEFFKEYGYTLREPVMEEYVTDPMAVQDTSKWLTRIVYPIK